jgi:hypothetical protein
MEISMYPRSQHSHEKSPGGGADALRPSLTPSLHRKRRNSSESTNVVDPMPKRFGDGLYHQKNGVLCGCYTVGIITCYNMS